MMSSQSCSRTYKHTDSHTYYINTTTQKTVWLLGRCQTLLSVTKQDTITVNNETYNVRSMLDFQANSGDAYNIAKNSEFINNIITQSQKSSDKIWYIYKNVNEDLKELCILAAELETLIKQNYKFEIVQEHPFKGFNVMQAVLANTLPNNEETNDIISQLQKLLLKTSFNNLWDCIQSPEKKQAIIADLQSCSSCTLQGGNYKRRSITLKNPIYKVSSFLS